MAEAPQSLFDYFPDEFLLIIDESHMTIPQFQAMPSADRSRKLNLINYIKDFRQLNPNIKITTKFKTFLKNKVNNLIKKKEWL